MSSKKGRISKNIISNNLYEDGSHELRRGPWTVEEDNLLIQYMNSHGEGQWNTLAKSAGLNRTGKSCRLRWLNYLKPDIKRGNLTPHEQLLILELHSRWGNRWSKIAQHLPGRTDNEIKNYWRTRVQKHARRLNVDSNSNKFLETVRMYWMPRLLEKMEQDNSSSVTSSPSSSITTQSCLAAPSPLADQLPPPPCLKSGSVVNYSDNDVKIPEMLCGKSIEDECYHVDILSYDIQELESRDVNESGVDWDDQGSFWNSEELWAI